MIFKIVISILIFLGIFARFFFGLETYNQIFISIGLSLIILAMFLPTDFWEKELSYVFNSEMSRCLARWVAFIIAFGFVIFLGISFHLTKVNIKHLERLKGLRYVSAHKCRHQCLYHNKHRIYLSDSSLSSILWFSWVPMIFLYFALTNSVKYSNNQLNLIKYSAQFRNKKRMLLKCLMYLVVNTPIILSAWIRVYNFWGDFTFKLSMSLLWVILYRIVFPMIKKNMEIFVNSDMFAPWMLDNDDEKTGLI